MGVVHRTTPKAPSPHVHETLQIGSELRGEFAGCGLVRWSQSTHTAVLNEEGIVAIFVHPVQEVASRIPTSLAIFDGFGEEPPDVVFRVAMSSSTHVGAFDHGLAAQQVFGTNTRFPKEQRGV